MSYKRDAMNYFLDLFSPETYEAFHKSNAQVSGFRVSQRNAASKIHPGDRLICYMTKLGRWCGVLEVESECYEDDSPIFYETDDPFVIRFKVKPIVLLDKAESIPIRDDRVWENLSFTKGRQKNTSNWTGGVRSSLTLLSKNDASLLESLLIQQASAHVKYPVDEKEYDRLLSHRVQTVGRAVSVLVPQESHRAQPNTASDVRESIKIQALLARIGAAMGLKIWLPKADRTAVLSEWTPKPDDLLNVLPLNYDTATLKTIEQIDVLWLRRRSIVRAFEVEHTTSIYSGLLRMADLLALQPNMDIRLHIVAPEDRRDKVFQEILRPVFSLLEKGPLAESCTFITYDNIRGLSSEKHLSHLSDSVLDEYEEIAE